MLVGGYMPLVLMNLNEKNTSYQFDMSVIDEEIWSDMAHAIVLAKGKRMKLLELKSAKVVIRENKAKFKVCFQDDLYHEHEYHLDVFGRDSRDYLDLVSEMFQDVMKSYYGAEYEKALSQRLAEDKQIINK